MGRFPVPGVVHIRVGDDVGVGSGGDDMGEQYTHSPVLAVSLHGLGQRQGSKVEVLGLLWNDGTEDAETELGTFRKPVLNLNSVNQRWDRGQGVYCAEDAACFICTGYSGMREACIPFPEKLGSPGWEKQPVLRLHRPLGLS